MTSHDIHAHNRFILGLLLLWSSGCLVEAPDLIYRIASDEQTNGKSSFVFRADSIKLTISCALTPMHGTTRLELQIENQSHLLAVIRLDKIVLDSQDFFYGFHPEFCMTYPEFKDSMIDCPAQSSREYMLCYLAEPKSFRNHNTVTSRFDQNLFISLEQIYLGSDTLRVNPIHFKLSE
jgi:hypothetical protein